jgi:hypothetical protein
LSGAGRRGIAAGFHPAGDFLAAVRQAEQVNTGARFIESPSPRSGPPAWKNILQAIQQAEQIQPDFSPEERLPGWVNTPGPAAHPVLVTEKGPVLSAALLTGDERLGSIELEGAPDRPWSEQEAGLLNSVAQQMVLHLENLRLLEQAEQYRQEAEQVVRRMTRTGWEDFLLEQGSTCSGFVYDQGQVISLQPGEAPEAGLFPAGGLARPIKVREETIGQLVIEAPGESGSTGLIDAVAERLGLQVESLRLWRRLDAPANSSTGGPSWRLSPR